MGEEDLDLSTTLTWDFEKFGFVSKEEFILWKYFQRKGNPNYYGEEVQTNTAHD